MSKGTVENMADRRPAEPSVRRAVRFSLEEIARAFGLTLAEVRKRLEQRSPTDGK